MCRTLMVCAMLLTPLVASAEPPKESIIQFNCSPAPFPKPALKYQLLPELKDMKAGNPILGYLRCFAEGNNFFFSKESYKQQEKWESMPIDQLPVEKMRTYGGTHLTQADWAARLTTPDWQALSHLRQDGARMLLPDVQQMRALARALKVRFRGEIADNRFEDALTTAQTMLAMAKHFEEHPTLISTLVGTAIGLIAEEALEEMIQQPNCPNLFWALSTLPRPLIQLRKAISGERLIWHVEMKPISDKAPMTEAKLEKFYQQVVLLLGYENGKNKEKEVRDWLKRKITDENYLSQARKRLAEVGLKQTVLKKFPATQIVWLDEKYRLVTALDEHHKFTFLPYSKAEALLKSIKEPKDVIFAKFGSFYLKIRQAQERVTQRFAMLQNLEAIRWYAYKEKGKLPKSLNDIQLPLLNDPITDKPFQYSVEGNKATLRNTPPSGQENNHAMKIRYVISIRK